MRPPAELIERLVELEPLAAEQPDRVRVVQAPGRVNLIGEHTDYNGGFVLPAAIDLGITVALVPPDDAGSALTRLDTGERASVDLDADRARAGRLDRLRRAGRRWAMRAAGLPTTGFRGVLGSDLPAGAGLASSAALELASAWALSGGERPPVDPMALARLAQRAENEHVGVACGLMDQFAVAFGVAGHALLLDCRSLDHRAVPLPAATRARDLRLAAPRGASRRRRTTRAGRSASAPWTRSASIDPGVRDLRDVDPGPARGRASAARRGGLSASPPRRDRERARPGRGRSHGRRRPGRGRGGVRREPPLAARRLRGELAGARRAGRHRGDRRRA